MAKKTFSVDNPDALANAIRGLSDAMSESTLRQAAVAGARVFFEEVKVRVPIAVKAYERNGTTIYPGFLRDHILIAFDKEQSIEGRHAAYIVTWSKEAFYGRFVEHGRSNMAANPFLRPAFEAKQQQAAQVAQDVVRKKLAEALGE